MTETPTDVALRYVREELSTLRATVHDELAAMRTDLSGLAGELRGHTAEQGPRIAVVEHRLSEAEKDVATLNADHQRDMADLRASQAGDRRLKWTVGGAVVVAVLAWVPDLMTMIGG